MDEELKQYLKAASILKSVLAGAKKEVKIGEKILRIVEKIENDISAQGGCAAFPPNISINDIAAHDTAAINDEREIPEGAVVKIDCGVHVNGFIADSAITIDLSEEHGKLCEAAVAALDDAICIIKDGIKICEIGKTIESKIKSYGFKPISNLTGHVMQRWVLHTGIEIPNCYVKSEKELNEGDIVALEPFATTGIGYVIESGRCEIYSEAEEKLFRSQTARKLFEKIKTYRKLPFAQRWIARTFEERAAFQEILKSRALKAYPVLRESGGGIVTQAEHTVIVEKDCARVIT